MSKSVFIVFLFGFLFFIACSQTQRRSTAENSSHSSPYTNRLINESSPYLLQHAHNPVDWYPWGEEALNKAKKENKPIIISIGYAACHWCHVMERESFEDEEVAKFMNDNFISIKVDREERPDIDQVYMSAVQLMTGRGGWPLNCIALPDGRPIYGGTYFPKDQWLSVLQQVNTAIHEKPEEVTKQAELLMEGILKSDLVILNESEKQYELEDLDRIFRNWKLHIDYINGGSKGAPKFPIPVTQQFLMRYYHASKNQDALKAVNLTLQKMAHGGIYDQLGGGFARYATDNKWKVPHFEKMLYDNAQLVSLYANAYQLTKNPLHKEVVQETLAFVKRELRNENGLFYSSLDADSEGEEGKYYVWSADAFKTIVGSDSAIFLDYFQVTEEGNWENGKNILLRQESFAKRLDHYGIEKGQWELKLATTKYKLLEERTQRIRPGLDDKVITAWNALMIKALVDAYRITHDELYLEDAIQTANFIVSIIKMKDSRLHRIYKNGKVSINGFLDDYAFTIDCFITLYQATFNEKWLLEAQELTEYTFQNFYNEETCMFYYTSKLDPELISRKTEITDNVIPSSNSQMARNLFTLGNYLYNQKYVEVSRSMLNNVEQMTIRGSEYFANWDILMLQFTEPVVEVAIVGKDATSFKKEFNSHFLPNVLFVGGEKEGELQLLKNKLVKGQTTIFVCRDKTCKLPVTNVKDALQQLRSN